jgi:hypothetical protein
VTKTLVKPEPLHVETTPRGIEVAYFVEPRRKYEIRRAGGRWKEVPSVTTVLGVLDKPALPWWGMRVGVQGVLTLFSMGLLKAYCEHGLAPVLACRSSDIDIVAGVPQIEDLLKRAKLTVNHVKDAAGDRGRGVHDAFELWAKEGHLPDPAMFPPAEQGYVQGLRRFIEESGAKAVAAEVQVGSVKHGYAGRYDIRIEYPNDVDLVVHHTPKRGEQRATLAAGVYLDDLKTSKDVYASHFLQLEAYEEASVECGYGPTEGRGVIHVDAEGNYKRVPSYATFADFRAVLGVWKAQERMKKRQKEQK